ncbi:MAG TPA: phosphotransferase [Thermoanaerobaculia bacterium]|nr:phosphotransferase [Thermoanaerobaculia bacterium]
MSQPLSIEMPPAGVDAWLSGAGYPPRQILCLTGDVSPRRYARVVLADGTTAVLATYPDEVRDVCPRFLRTGELLDGAGVRVPHILAASCEQGWMLLEDLGLQTLGDQRERPWSELRPYFARALEVIGRIQALPVDMVAGLNPVLGRELLRRELAQTWDLFLAPRELTGGRALTAALAAALDALCDYLGAETPVPCHRDFMVRNLMPLDEGTVPAGGIVVLDHQDLRLGPPAYDLASLLNDTLFPPAEIEEELLAAALGGADRQSYHRAAAQRTLKAVGTYTKFSLRGANRHLPLIPPTLARFLDHLAWIPEGAPVAGDLRRLWEPVLQPART